MISDEVKLIVKNLQKIGICVIEDYFSESECDECVLDIDRCMVEFYNKVQRHQEVQEGNDGDERIFKIENQSNLASKLAQDEFILEIGRYFYNNFPCETFQVLGQRLIFDSKYNRGSGGGWHIDSKTKPQLKALVYLTDVGKDNGVYMFLPDSFDLDLELRKNDPKKRITRFTDESVEKCGIEPFVVTGKKGTLILVDTSHVHRGAIIKQGKRYSLTSYIHRSIEKDKQKFKQKWGDWYVPKK